MGGLDVILVNGGVCGRGVSVLCAAVDGGSKHSLSACGGFSVDTLVLALHYLVVYF